MAALRVTAVRVSKTGWQIVLDDHPNVVTYARGRWRVRRAARAAAAETIGHRPLRVSVVHQQPATLPGRLSAEPR